MILKFKAVPKLIPKPTKLSRGDERCRVMATQGPVPNTGLVLTGKTWRRSCEFHGRTASKK